MGLPRGVLDRIQTTVDVQYGSTVTGNTSRGDQIGAQSQTGYTISASRARRSVQISVDRHYRSQAYYVGIVLARTRRPQRTSHCRPAPALPPSACSYVVLLPAKNAVS